MHDPITYFQALILGIVQGLTEFLPVSSSAHLLIVSTFAGWDDPGAAFTAVTQIGTETAVLIYFRHDIWRILSTWTRSLYTPELRSNIDARMGWYVIFGTLPIGFFGFVFSSQIETAARNLWLVATVLIVFGLVLGAADRWGPQTKTLDDLNIKTGLVFGFGQALALIPGVSRSGATISTGRFMGFDRPAATRYAFLLAIPAVLVSGAVRGAEDRRRQERLLGADDSGHDHRVLRRVRRDRMADPVCVPRLVPAVRDLPGRPGLVPLRDARHRGHHCLEAAPRAPLTATRSV